MANFITDFLSYNIGTECPKNYLRWAAVSAICIAGGLKYKLKQGRIDIDLRTYYALVGEQGVRKSYAKDQVRALIEEALPDHPIGADLTTRDDIVRFMSTDDCERAFTNADGESLTYRPLALFINELKHFLSYNPSLMISFLVDIYDRDFFKGSTIKRGTEEIERPCLCILACENTDWLVNSLKQGIITGGFSRRFVVIYEPEDETVVIPRPYLPANHKELWSRMIDKLRAIQQTSKKYEWEPDAIKFFDEWYREHKKNMSDDKIIRGFERTQDQQMLKLAMALDLAETDPSYNITVHLLQLSLGYFEQIKPNMPKLYVAAGRNNLAVPQAELHEALKSAGGLMSERDFLRKADKNMNPAEKLSVIRNLKELQMVFRANITGGEWGQAGKYFATTEKLAEIKKAGGSFQGCD